MLELGWGQWPWQLAQTASPNATAVMQLICLWLIGVVAGWLLPRPKSTGTGATWWRVFTAFSTPPAWWRRALLTWHGLLIVREVWVHFTRPGTMRAFGAALLALFAGKGWHYQFPAPPQPGAAQATSNDPKVASKGAEDSWYVTPKDLAFFKQFGEPGVDAPRPPGYGAWEVMMDREIPGVLKYTAWRRFLPTGKTEYRSVTISPDATAHEFMDMYFDDDNRPNWDTMIIHNDVLEHGMFDQRQQVVRWIRRFPFSFITDREYIIAKRLFKEGDALYGLTKAVEHPRAPGGSSVVRVEDFYSMWRSRTVECPWGSGNPACETILLHHEQMKIPENLARFAVKHGMWGFVRKLSSETPKFVESRRRRCPPNESDPQAYGSGWKPNPPLPLLTGAASALDCQAGMARTSTCASGLSSLCTQSSLDVSMEGPDGYHRSVSASGLARTRSGKIKGLAAFALASGLAMLLKHSSSSERLPSCSSSGASFVSASGRRAGSANNLRRMRRARTTACLMDGAGVQEVAGM